MNHTIRHLALCAVAAMLGACSQGEHAKGQAPAAPIQVRIETVRRETVARTMTLSGTLKAVETAAVASKVPGTIREVRVRAGDKVKTGDTLVLLAAAEVEAGVAAARSGIAETEQGLIAARAAAQLSAATFARIEGLLAKGAVTRQEFDEAKARNDQAQAGLDMAAARRDGARSALAEAEARLGYARVTAPFDGWVTERRADPGDFASPGTPLLTVARRAVRVEAMVPESLASALKLGDAATVDLGLATSVAGRVAEMEPAVEAATRSFLVKIDLPPEVSGVELRPGGFARVSLSVGQVERLLAPRAALASRGQLDSVYVRDAQTARLRLVTLGEATGERIEVLSGLGAGEEVIVSPPASLSDGAPITVAP